MSTFMLDSGAFSAWNSGTAIDLDQYIAYIKAHAEFIDYYVALDVIPGSFGVTPSPEEVEVSAQKSWNNLLYMQSEGLEPVPVFHMGEQFKWLRRMVEHGCKYIGISPANDRTTSAKREWLDRVFDEITDKDGWPIVKTHAFGVTAIDLLIRYPWYSADSTTWIMIAARGRILVPVWEGGKWDFNKKAKIYYISEPAGEGETLLRNKQLLKWKDVPSQVEYVTKWLDFCGVTMQEATDDYRLRTVICAKFFQEFERGFVPTPFKRTRNHLFKDQ